MLGLNQTMRIFAYSKPADMRNGFDGLSSLVRNELGHDPLSGALYLFTNRDRTRAKVLHFDGSGLCVYAKRLEKGRFATLWGDDGPLELSTAELQLFLEGSTLVGKITLSPKKLCTADLAIAGQI
jgi:transposase